MAQKRNTDQTKVILDAALHLAARKGWDKTTHEAILKQAKVKTAPAPLDSKDKILTALIERLDRETFDSVMEDEDISTRDRLFEILMARFDVLSENKRAWISILRSSLRCPHRLRGAAPAFRHSMHEILEKSGFETSRYNEIFAAGLSLLYMSVVYVWMDDDTADLAKTMATLDKRLDQAENLMPYIRK